MRVNVICAVLGSAVTSVAGCGSDGDGDPATGAGGDGGGAASASCTVTATATADEVARTITGVGSADCSASAIVEIETCVQWNPNGAFEDIQCIGSTQSGAAELEVESLASCGFGTGRRYRARVNATINGTAQPEEVSADIGCE